MGLLGALQPRSADLHCRRSHPLRKRLLGGEQVAAVARDLLTCETRLISQCPKPGPLVSRSTAVRFSVLSLFNNLLLRAL